MTTYHLNWDVQDDRLVIQLAAGDDQGNWTVSEIAIPREALIPTIWQADMRKAMKADQAKPPQD